MLSSKDMNFVGYTYKNFEIVNDPELPGIGWIYISFRAHLFLVAFFPKSGLGIFFAQYIICDFSFLALQLN